MQQIQFYDFNIYEIRELHRWIETNDLRYFPQVVNKYCTRPFSKHLYSGIFKDPLNTKHKIFKKKTEFTNVMFHVINWSISLKVVKL